MSVLVKCKDHPKYKAIRKPRANCGTCELLFLLTNGEALESETLRPPFRFSKLVAANA